MPKPERMNAPSSAAWEQLGHRYSRVDVTLGRGLLPLRSEAAGKSAQSTVVLTLFADMTMHFEISALCIQHTI